MFHRFNIEHGRFALIFIRFFLEAMAMLKKAIIVVQLEASGLLLFKTILINKELPQNITFSLEILLGGHKSSSNNMFSINRSLLAVWRNPLQVKHYNYA